jgi:hypothetical protein
MRWYNASGVNTTRVDVPVPQIRHRTFLRQRADPIWAGQRQPGVEDSGGKRVTSPICSETGTVRGQLRLIFSAIKKN